ncbi:MAG TPA: exopolysaccharide biosynthesis protein [Alphaproteobacteria bacterium]|jgi:hypothetical protein
MAAKKKSRNLNGMLDDLSDAAKKGERVAIADVLNTIGRRAFGSLLLVPGLVVLSPLASIPGVGTAAGVVVLLIAGQLLVGADSFWLPRFVRRSSVDRESFAKAIKTMRPVARVVDKLLRPRLDVLTREPATYGVAAICIVLALTLPVLDFVPFTALVPAAAITAFGLALIAHDGALAVVAFAFSAASLVPVGMLLL